MRDTSSFGYWLRRRRKALDLTQQALAQQAGCATITLRKIEAGELRPSAQIAERLATCLALEGDERRDFLKSARSLLVEDTTRLPQQSVPPPAALPLARPTLPVPPNPLIGREQEVAAVQGILLRPDVRLLTLTGAGGTGKTRLAIAVASGLRDAFAHGACFVDLAPLRDPQLVVPSIAQAFGVKERASTSSIQVLREVLRERELLLVLDNFEQVLAAAHEIAALLLMAPRLTLLATSRAALHLQGEHEYHVPPLVVPETHHLLPLERLAQCEAVQLFVARAQAARPDFALDADNAAAVAQICRQLDGLPLAIELAAARVKLFPPNTLLNELRSPLALLTNGPRDLPARQRTLRNTIDWSYHLLQGRERRLFRQLGVFVGGATLAAVEAVCNDGANARFSTIEDVTALLDHSLIRGETGPEGEVRVAMLEITREYALEQLAQHNEGELLHGRHAAYYRALAEEAEPGFRSASQAAWLARIERDLGNVRAALAWCVERDAATAAQVAGALWWFWYYSGRYGEGQRWSEAAFERSAPLGATTARAKAALGAAMLALYGAKLARAQQLCEAGLAMASTIGDQHQLALARNILGTLARTRGDYADARRHYEEGLALARANAEPWLTALALSNLGIMAFHQDDAATAATALAQGLDLFRVVGDTWYIAIVLHILGRVARRSGDTEQAASYHHESLALFRELGNQWGVALNVGGLAAVAGAREDAEGAAELLGAEEALRETVGEPLFPTIRRDHERVIEALRAELGEARLAAAWARGRALRLGEVFARPLA